IGSNLLILGDLPLSTDTNPIQVAVALLKIVLASFVGIKLFKRSRYKNLKFIALFLLIPSLLLLSQYIYLDWTTIIGALVAIAILSLSVYAIYYLIKQEPWQCWLYIICLMLSLPLPMLITDIINQGQSSTAPRYLIPWQLSILIAIAYILEAKLNYRQLYLKHLQAPRLWSSLLIAFLAIGIYSNVRNLNVSPFYQKGRNINNPAIAKIINDNHADKSSLVVVEAGEAMDLVSLAYSLAPDVKYKVIKSAADLNNYLPRFQQVYLLKPTPNIKQDLRTSSLELRQVYKSHVYSADEFPLDLWQIGVGH
ncbi:MAG: hypothetical protein AAFQ41_13255, partial [Cyanobacteria bacterium J06623_7]